jgi:hypothetical protein
MGVLNLFNFVNTCHMGLNQVSPTLVFAFWPQAVFPTVLCGNVRCPDEKSSSDQRPCLLQNFRVLLCSAVLEE